MVMVVMVVSVLIVVGGCMMVQEGVDPISQADLTVLVVMAQEEVQGTVMVVTLSMILEAGDVLHVRSLLVLRMAHGLTLQLMARTLAL